MDIVEKIRKKMELEGVQAAKKWNDSLEVNRRKYDELEPEYKEELDRKFKGK